LERPEPKQIEKISVEPDYPATNALAQVTVDARALPQHPVDELACPPSISSVEMKFIAHTTVERSIEQLSCAELRTNGCGCGTRVGNTSCASSFSRTCSCLRRLIPSDCRTTFLPTARHSRKDSGWRHGRYSHAAIVARRDHRRGYVIIAVAESKHSPTVAPRPRAQS
jgi:hypothetical protein